MRCYLAMSFRLTKFDGASVSLSSLPCLRRRVLKFDIRRFLSAKALKRLPMRYNRLCLAVTVASFVGHRKAWPILRAILYSIESSFHFQTKEDLC